ncbi:MAG TPA: vitamin K epoxide reductase family protein [Solirubrobacteraceae bacterium]|nr:vitamin K epoxide reductase family protein [Solirubrobacteraceae bacterium]
MSRITLRRVMLAITVLGIILASYLVYVHYSGTKPICTASTACLTVQRSQWSKVAGIPVALIGLIGYIGIFIALLLRDNELDRTAVLGMTFIGFGFSGYLTYRELFSIHQVCEECATSAVFMTLLFICSLWRFLNAPLSAAPAGPVATPAERGKIAPVPGQKQAKQAAVRR